MKIWKSRKLSRKHNIYGKKRRSKEENSNKEGGCDFVVLDRSKIKAKVEKGERREKIGGVQQSKVNKTKKNLCERRTTKCKSNRWRGRVYKSKGISWMLVVFLPMKPPNECVVVSRTMTTKSFTKKTNKCHCNNSKIFCDLFSNCGAQEVKLGCNIVQTL